MISKAEINCASVDAEEGDCPKAISMYLAKGAGSISFSIPGRPNRTPANNRLRDARVKRNILDLNLKVNRA